MQRAVLPKSAATLQSAPVVTEPEGAGAGPAALGVIVTDLVPTAVLTDKVPVGVPEPILVIVVVKTQFAPDAKELPQVDVGPLYPDPVIDIAPSVTLPCPVFDNVAVQVTNTPAVADAGVHAFATNVNDGDAVFHVCVHLPITTADPDAGERTLFKTDSKRPLTVRLLTKLVILALAADATSGVKVTTIWQVAFG